MKTLITVLKESKEINLQAGNVYELFMDNENLLARTLSEDEIEEYRKECIKNLPTKGKRCIQRAGNLSIFDNSPIGLKIDELNYLLEGNGYSLGPTTWRLACDFFNYGYYLGKIAGKKGFY